MQTPVYSGSPHVYIAPIVKNGSVTPIGSLHIFTLLPPPSHMACDVIKIKNRKKNQKINKNK
jgi:hypothetical protein